MAAPVAEPIADAILGGGGDGILDSDLNNSNNPVFVIDDADISVCAFIQYI